MNKQINVNTPRGMKYHGEIRDNVFIRKVDYDKDRMRIYNSWSIHPDALREITDKVQKLKYIADDDFYTIKLSKAKEKGFYKNHAGGETFYIPLKFWERTNKYEQKML